MFAGHYSTAFATKAAVPRVPLRTVLLAAQLIDLVWVLFVLAGLEHTRLGSLVERQEGPPAGAAPSPLPSQR